MREKVLLVEYTASENFVAMASPHLSVEVREMRRELEDLKLVVESAITEVQGMRLQMERLLAFFEGENQARVFSPVQPDSPPPAEDPPTPPQLRRQRAQFFSPPPVTLSSFLGNS